MTSRKHDVNRITHRSAQRPPGCNIAVIRLPVDSVPRREEETVERRGCSQRRGGATDGKVVVTAAVIATPNAEGTGHIDICILEHADGAPLVVAVVPIAIRDAAPVLCRKARALCIRCRAVAHVYRIRVYDLKHCISRLHCATDCGWRRGLRTAAHV